MSAPGSEARGRRGLTHGRSRGFTLIELLVVVAIIAIASAAVTLSLRDPSEARLEREGLRLAALLEAARAEARASGLAVRWIPRAEGGGAGSGFRFVGLPARQTPPTGWLDEGVSAEIFAGSGSPPAAVLGPEPVIGAQRIVLRLQSQQLTLATDGLGPFAIAPEVERAGSASR